VSVQEIAVLMAARYLDHDLDVAGMAEDGELVLRNEGDTASM
jgi:hypothetical protein